MKDRLLSTKTTFAVIAKGLDTLFNSKNVKVVGEKKVTATQSMLAQRN